MHSTLKTALWLSAACATLIGCEGQPSLFPNSDPALRKTSTQFAADAARRFPYPAGADRGGQAQGRAEVDLTFAQLQILNYSDEDWKDIDIWINRGFVCHVPLIAKGKQKVETLNFQMIYNSEGHHFDTDGGKSPMKQVEMVKDGKVYQIPLALAD